jgi:hypothetical protein
MPNYERVKSLLVDAEAIIKAGDEINRLNPEQSPIDLEVERVVRGIAKKAIAAYEVGDKTKFDKYVDELDRYARRQLRSKQ